MYRTNGTLGPASISVTPVDLPAGPGDAVGGVDYIVYTNTSSYLTEFGKTLSANVANPVWPSSGGYAYDYFYDYYGRVDYGYTELGYDDTWHLADGIYGQNQGYFHAWR